MAKTTKRSDGPADVAGGNPEIKSMPALTREEVLRDERDTAREEAKKLARENAGLDKLKVHLESEVAKLKAQFDALQENPLLYAMMNLECGTALDQAGEDFKALCAACSKAEDKGSLTLKLALKPFKAGAFEYEMKVDVKAPKLGAAPGLIYVAEDGTCSRNDPRQKEFKFGGGSRGDRSGPGDSYDNEGGAE